MQRMNFIYAILLLALSTGMCGVLSCKKLVDVASPVTNTNEDNVYKDDVTATSVLTGLYAQMSNDNFTGGGSDNVGMSADEFILYQGYGAYQTVEYYTNSLSSSQSQGAGYETWRSCYIYLYITNAAIEGVSNSNSLTPAVKKQLLGEAKFMRALNYFYLVTLYGDAPLVLHTAYQDNTLIARAPKDQVWAQIISDLKDADTLLSPHFVDVTLLNTTTERTRPTKWAADALLARSYLYQKDYPNAETEASQVIDHAGLFGLSSLDSVFLKNSAEAIFQFQPINVNGNATDAFRFIIPPSGPSVYGTYLYLDTFLLKDFEPGDQRRTHWVDSVVAGGVVYSFPYKYKINFTAPTTEYNMVLRLAEQYLIRAEARSQQDNLQGVDDLNAVRSRAKLPGYTGPTDRISMLNAIMHERRIELFSEWGYRWQDLKRTGMVDSVMSIATPRKGGTWQTTDQLYPLNIAEIHSDPRLVQNPGY